jgi:hypothetical protein
LPAYVALIPGYAALWYGGRWFAGRYTEMPMAFAWLGASAVASTFVCQLITSGAFYFFSGRFAEPTFAEFANRIAKFYPMFGASTAFWIVLVAIVHTGIVMARRYGLRTERA